MRWIPDVLLADGTLIEIKGYVTAQAMAKFEFFFAHGASSLRLT